MVNKHLYLLLFSIKNTKIINSKIIHKREENKKKLELSLNEKKNTQYPFPISTPSLDKDEWDLGDDDAGYVYSIISGDFLSPSKLKIQHR